MKGFRSRSGDFNPSIREPSEEPKRASPTARNAAGGIALLIDMPDTKSKPRWGTWLVLAVLVGLLGLAIVILYVGWGSNEDVAGGTMTGSGYVAMTLGIIATLALGIGLMILVFHSNRSGRD